MGSRPTLIVNHRAGRGRQQPAVVAAALARGMAIQHLTPTVDAAAAARRAVRDGADVLAAAGGDGTVSAVAAVAVETSVPLVVVPCGTRNHFAGDCGADIADPTRMLTALDTGEEHRVDVGSVNGRLFVNNVSLGFYAASLQDPQYRHGRLRVARRYLRRAVLGTGKAVTLTTPKPSRVVLPRQALAVLVSNNAYFPTIAPEGALRPRLSGGALWVYVLGVPTGTGMVGTRIARRVLRLLSGRAQVAAWAFDRQMITVDAPRIPAAIDGEATQLGGALTFASHPGALRVLRPPSVDTPTTRVRLQW
jgi:diacylglycerol kinase family enzyme